MQQLNLDSALKILQPNKEEGIPTQSLALQIINEALFGYSKGIRSIDPISQVDFGVLSGLPFICSNSTEYRFLNSISMEKSDALQLKIGKLLVELGQIEGDIVNMDGHSIPLFSRKEMKASYLSKQKTYGKALRVFYTQDQLSRKPLFVKSSYSGTTVSQITPTLVNGTQAVLKNSFLSVMDKEWFVGPLLEYLDKVSRIEVLLPIKRTSKRIKEMKSISFGQFRHKNGKCPVAVLFTELDGFVGHLRLFVKRNDDGSYFGLITNKKYLQATKALNYYSRRWRIENWFNENVFLGLNSLPSLELNAIQAVLVLRVVAYHVLDNFRCDLGGQFASMKPETIHRHFVNGVQGKIQLKRDIINIDIYGFQYLDTVIKYFSNLDKKLIGNDIDPRVPWLNNHKLNFCFK